MLVLCFKPLTMLVSTFICHLLKRGEKGLKEHYGLAAQDACCACGGGNYVCDKYQYLYGSFAL